MPICLIVGGSGYLGSALLRLAEQRGIDAVGTRFNSGIGLPCLDIRDGAAVSMFVSQLAPSVVFNAAYSQLASDKWATTIRGARNVAVAARSVGARLLHLSTDVVFDGEDAPYAANDPVSPITPYGRAKAEAETLVMAAHPDALVVRTSLLYGGPENEGPQEALVRRAIATDEVAFFTDEVRCPILVDALAARLFTLAEGEQRGPVHAAGAEAMNRFTFARHLASLLGLDASRLRAADSGSSTAIRPRDCRLS